MSFRVLHSPITGRSMGSSSEVESGTLRGAGAIEGPFVASEGFKSRVVEDRFVFGFVILIGSEDERDD